MPPTHSLEIDGITAGPVSIDSLSERLAGLSGLPRAELRIHEVDGPSLCLLKSDDRALLTFLSNDEDPGQTSRDGGTSASPADLVEFTLSNGQIDQYPASWTVDYAVARRVVEYFWFRREPAPFIAWHHDP